MPQVSATFARKFYWSELNLWPDDLPANTCVMLSGDDDLVHAREIRALLEKAGNVTVGARRHAAGEVVTAAMLWTLVRISATQQLPGTSGTGGKSADIQHCTT